MHWKQALGVIAAMLGAYCFVPYFRDFFACKTRPHAFTWFIWSLLSGISFAGQTYGSGGAGSWTTGIAALGCFAVFLCALVGGEKQITYSDWCSLIAALGAILLWILTKTPVLSVILVVILDTIAFWPTVRKSYHRPEEETISSFALGGLQFVIALFALEHYSLVTWLFPAALALSNGLFVAMLLIRRSQLRKNE